MKNAKVLSMALIGIFISCLGSISEAIRSLFAIVSLLTIIAFVIGIAKPSLVKMESRKKVISRLGMASLAVFYLFCLTFSIQQGISSVIMWFAFPVLVLFVLGIINPNWIKANSKKWVLKYLGAPSFILLTLVGLFAPPIDTEINDSRQNAINESGINQTNSENVTSTQDTEQTENVPPEPIKQEEQKPITKNITVTNLINKKIDGKCRYFFNIRNEDSSDFTGSVTIDIFTSSARIAGDKFTSTQPTRPQGGSSVYFDANTCPTAGGGNAIKFSFKIEENNQTINSGEAGLTDKFEDLDATSRALGY